MDDSEAVKFQKVPLERPKKLVEEAVEWKASKTIEMRRQHNADHEDIRWLNSSEIKAYYDKMHTRLCAQMLSGDEETLLKIAEEYADSQTKKRAIRRSQLVERPFSRN